MWEQGVSGWCKNGDWGSPTVLGPQGALADERKANADPLRGTLPAGQTPQPFALPPSSPFLRGGEGVGS